MTARVRRAFIVDDEDLIRRSLTRLLRRIGFDVIVFGTPEDAMSRLAEGPDLLVCDYHLPRIDGLAISAEAKRVSPKTRTMILSGGAEDAPLLAALAAKTVDRFLTKPWNHDELIATIHTLLDR